MQNCRSCFNSIAQSAKSCVHCGEEYPFYVYCDNCNKPMDGPYKGYEIDWSKIRKEEQVCNHCLFPPFIANNYTLVVVGGGLILIVILWTLALWLWGN